MNQISCKSKIISDKRKEKSKNRKSKKRKGEKSVLYPNFNELRVKTFQIEYEKQLSSTAKFLLKNFQNKSLYYAIDDILYLLKSDPVEQDNLLALLYSPVLSLQNNFYISFFDIWIHEIYINQVLTTNKFLPNENQNIKQSNYITIKLFYRIKNPIKKQELLW